jgi:hypothetical protein
MPHAIGAWARTHNAHTHKFMPKHTFLEGHIVQISFANANLQFIIV